METWILRQNLILRGTGQNSICTHRYSQGPKEADSWCPMSTFPSDHSVGVQWHTAIFTVNKQMLHLWILQFSPATPHEKQMNSASKHVSSNHIIPKHLKKKIYLVYHRKLQLLYRVYIESIEYIQNIRWTSLVVYVRMHTLHYGMKFLFYCGTISSCKKRIRVWFNGTKQFAVCPYSTTQMWSN